jgi:alpha-L-rhamnosidase
MTQRTIKTALVLWVLILWFCKPARSATVASANLQPERLRCEYLQNPFGIDTARPRLMWVLTSDQRGQAQSAYQVIVASTPEVLAAGQGDFWDSGKVDSDQTLGIPYAGKALTSRQRCYWKVRVWDRDGVASRWTGPAVWSMGLLDRGDWHAQWIADPQSFSLAASPPRAPHNGFHSGLVGAADTQEWVAIDLKRVQAVDGVRLFPARPYDVSPEVPGFCFPVRFRIEVAQKADFSDAAIVVDRTAADVVNPGSQPQLFRFASVEARHVRLTVTRLAERPAMGGFAFTLAEMQALHRDEVLSLNAPVTASSAITSGGWAPGNLTDGRIEPDRGNTGVPPPQASAAMMARKDFDVAGSVRRATVYVTGLGLYRLSINGQRVGDQIMAPEWTDYRKRIQYQTYDITSLVHPGANAIGAMTGAGWFGGPLQTRTYNGHETDRLLLRLEVETDDGKTQVLVSDPTWRTTLDGPITQATIYDGETYDATKEKAGWDEPGFNDAGWNTAVRVQDLFSSVPLVAQPNEPIRVMRELKAVAMTQPRPGVWVFDMGQNMVGHARVTFRGKRGQVVQIRHAEMLNDDGTIYTANLRGAAETISYLPRDDAQVTFEPDFTYMGFRYVQLSGLAQPPTAAAVIGRVCYSSAAEAGKFETSSDQLNAIMRMIVWVQRANLQSVPTDCPQRSERLGWMGDIQAFSQTAIYNMDLAAFITKWTADIRDAQTDDGRFSNISPNPGNPTGAAMGWADAGTIVPWRAYQNYADLRLIRDHYAAARRWIEHLHLADPTLTASLGGYGDWLNGDTLVMKGWPQEGGAVPGDIFDTAFFAHSTQIVSEMASVIGHDEEARTYAALFEQIKEAFNRKFVTLDGRITGETQGGYALALNFDLLPDSLRPLAVQHMIEGFARYDGHLSTGIQTTHRLMLELSRNGHHDEALRLINLRTFPSWGCMVDNGATTVWERWDGYVKGRGFQDPGMNSFNHWALGSVGEWMWRDLAGINGDDAGPGFKHIIIRPLLGANGDGPTWVRGTYDSIRGPITSNWKIENGKFSLRVAIPPSTTATVYFPSTDLQSINEGGQPATQAGNVKFLREENGTALFEIASGTYDFTAPR